MQARIRTAHWDHIFEVAADRSASARSAIAASWKRSLLRHGLDPRQSRPPRRVTLQHLRLAQEQMEVLMAAAQPNLDALFQAVGSTGCCVVLTDRNGIVLDRRGQAGDDDAFQSWGLWTGAVWSEDSEGTNGIGTCLVEERALTIHRDQHFHTRNIGMSCSTAPLYDHDGRLAGAIDVTSCRPESAEAFVGLIAFAAAETARRIEAMNFRRAFAHARSKRSAWHVVKARRAPAAAPELRSAGLRPRILRNSVVRPVGLGSIGAATDLVCVMAILAVILPVADGAYLILRSTTERQ